MARFVPAWGVFRDGYLVSTSKGMLETDAREQEQKLNAFNPVGNYKVGLMAGKMIEESSGKAQGT